MTRTLRGTVWVWLVAVLPFAIVFFGAPAQGFAKAVEEADAMLGGEVVEDGSDLPEDADEVAAEEETLEAEEGVVVEEADPQDVVLEAQSATVADPRVVTDSSMEAGQKVTWDCVWLGSYPQSVVTDADTVTALDTATGWSASGDLGYGGATYRRLKKADAASSPSSSGYWDWGQASSKGYCYFKWKPIKWRILETDGSSALVISDSGLDFKHYHTNESEITWATCTLRSWLNGYGASDNQAGTDFTSNNFVHTAFSVQEASAIVCGAIRNESSSTYALGGSDINDRVFLLSESEACDTNYGFSSLEGPRDEGRLCKPTDYARAMGVWVTGLDGCAGNCYWWLRTSGDDSSFASCVDYGGYVLGRSDEASIACDGVRPVMRVELTSPSVASAGTVSNDGTSREIAAPDATHQDASTAAKLEPIQITSLVLTSATFAYDGVAKTPTIIVRAGNTIVSASGYAVTYRNNVNAGTATVTITGKGNYVGTKSAMFQIAKAANGLTAAAKKKGAILKAKGLKKKTQSVKASKLITVKGCQGKVTYKLKSVTKKKFKKFFKVATSGKITAKKGLPKGTYRLKLAVTAAGDANHEKATRTITCKVAVK